MEQGLKDQINALTDRSNRLMHEHAALLLLVETMLICSDPALLARIKEGFEIAANARMASMLQHAEKDSTVHLHDAALQARLDWLRRQARW